MRTRVLCNVLAEGGRLAAVRARGYDSGGSTPFSRGKRPPPHPRPHDSDAVDAAGPAAAPAPFHPTAASGRDGRTAHAQPLRDAPRSQMTPSHVGCPPRSHGHRSSTRDIGRRATHGTRAGVGRERGDPSFGGDVDMAAVAPASTLSTAAGAWTAVGRKAARGRGDDAQRGREEVALRADEVYERHLMAAGDGLLKDFNVVDLEVPSGPRSLPPGGYNSGARMSRPRAAPANRRRSLISTTSCETLMDLVRKRAAAVIRETRAVRSGEATAGYDLSQAHQEFNAVRDHAVAWLRDKDPLPVHVRVAGVLAAEMVRTQSRSSHWMVVFAETVARWAAAQRARARPGSQQRHTGAAPGVPLSLHADLLSAMCRSRTAPPALVEKISQHIQHRAATAPEEFTPAVQADVLAALAEMSRRRRMFVDPLGEAAGAGDGLHTDAGGGGGCATDPLDRRRDTRGIADAGGGTGTRDGGGVTHAVGLAGARGPVESRTKAHDTALGPPGGGEECRVVRACATAVSSVVEAFAMRVWLVGYTPHELGKLAWSLGYLHRTEGVAGGRNPPPSLLPLLCGRVAERSVAVQCDDRTVARVVWAMGHTRHTDRAVFDALCTQRRAQRMGLLDIAYVLWGMVELQSAHRPFLKKLNDSLQHRDAALRTADATAVCTILATAGPLRLFKSVCVRLFRAAYTLLHHLTPAEAVGVLLSTVDAHYDPPEHCRTEVERHVRAHLHIPAVAAAYERYTERRMAASTERVSKMLRGM